MVVRVYRNLHTGGLSVLYKRKLLLHTDEVWLKDVKYVVSQPGRNRVLKEKRKNVHAWVQGTLVTKMDSVIDGLGPAVEVSYNPYKFGYFYIKETGMEAQHAAWVRVSTKRGKGVLSFATNYDNS